MGTTTLERQFLSERDAATILGLTVKTLQKYRFRNRGPRFRRLNGRCIRYNINDLYAWVQAQPEGGDPIITGAKTPAGRGG
jgi:predicted DNA-binding transcriptional regulator AlpA